MSVNEKIRLIREAKGLTQEQVAEQLQISKNGYGDIERGDCDVKLSKLQGIADVLEISLSDLVDVSDKGTININFPNQQNKTNHQNHVYVGSNNAELIEQKLINKFKEKELEFKNKEIELLNRIIGLMEEKLSKPEDD